MIKIVRVSKKGKRELWGSDEYEVREGNKVVAGFCDNQNSSTLGLLKLAIHAYYAQEFLQAFVTTGENHEQH